MQSTYRLLQLFAEAEAANSGEEAVDAGQNETPAQESAAPVRMSWKDIMEDTEYRKEYDAQVQEIVRRRLKGRQNAEEKLERLKPVLDAVGRRFAGTDDLDAVDANELAGRISESANAGRRERAREHLGRMLEEEKLMREKYPDFRLEDEMKNESFVRLTAPHTGLSLEDAYCAVHYRQISEAAARRSLTALSNSVCAGRALPKEISGRQSASMSTNDPKLMSREQREALKKRIYEAKAQGKRLPYGG